MQGELFYAHPELISRLSSPLARLIQVPLSLENKRDYNCCPKDVSAATFDRFLEWAYQGYYKQPSPTPDSKVGRDREENTENAPRPTTTEDTGQDNQVIHETPAPLPAKDMDCDEDWGLNKEHPELQDVPSPAQAPAPDIDWGIHGIRKKSKKGMAKKSLWGVEATAIRSPEPAPSQRDELKKAFCRLKLPVPPRSKDQRSPRMNLNAGEDYTDVFLCHAELYVFAIQNEIGGLRALALHKLHAVLAGFKLYQERTGDIIALLGYSYAKTESPDSGKEPLRELLASYVAFEMDTLMLDGRFEDLMKGGGDMLSDYMSSVLKRIKS